MTLRLLNPRLSLALTVAVTLSGRVFAGPPVVFWASDPVRPGEAVTVIGDGFGETPQIEVARLADEPAKLPQAIAWSGPGRKVEPIQASGESVKFVVPQDFQPGVFGFRIATGEGSTEGLLNRPRAWWIQGDAGTTASPGGSIRVFGLNLAGAKTVIRLEGPKTSVLAAEANAYDAGCRLPEDLPAGRYQVCIQNGWGGNAAWSDPLAIAVAAPAAWPAAVLNVKEFGAEGDGRKDDTAAILAALAKAEQNGGGVVFFPRGRYAVSDALTIPRHTVLRGASCESVCLAWPDLAAPPTALVQGTNSFAIEELTLYANNYRHVIVGDLGDQPEAGNVRLHHVRVRANIYRGHPTPEQVDERFRASLRLSTGGGDTVRLGGANVQITDCDLYGSGRVMFLSRVRGGRVSGNKLYNGRWGWYCISGSDGLVFENNELIGADLMSTGGGLNCLDGSAYSQNVFFAHNQLRRMHGWDREAMTSDAGGEAYFGKILSADGTKLTLAGEPNWRNKDWTGAGVFVLAGKGAGQYRRIASCEGTTVQVDRPWAVSPDAGSDICMTMFHCHYILLDNEFTDTGAMQFYGTSIECLVAENRGARMQGFRGLGLWYHGYQPSWFCQFLDNQILEGNYYHWSSATEAILEVLGAKHGPYEGPLNRGAVLRRNTLHNNAQIRVTGTCADAIVEGNRVENAQQAIFVSRDTTRVLVRGNSFHDVAREIVDEEAIRKAAEERLKRFLGRREPVAVWSFEEMVGTKFADSSGSSFVASPQGGAKAVDEGIRGRAVRFDGTGYLRVDEPAVFNAPDLTISLWVKPDTVGGRRGLIAKRFSGTAAPWVLSQNGANLGFEATEENGPWTFNFQASEALKDQQWMHVAAVVRRGVGVTLYVNGQPVAKKDNAANRATNDEPVILGREAWGGDPPNSNQPGFFMGLIDEVKIWTRALSPEEIQAEATAPQDKPGP